MITQCLAEVPILAHFKFEDLIARLPAGTSTGRVASIFSQLEQVVRAHVSSLVANDVVSEVDLKLCCPGWKMGENLILSIRADFAPLTAVGARQEVLHLFRKPHDSSFFWSFSPKC